MIVLHADVLFADRQIVAILEQYEEDFSLLELCRECDIGADQRFWWSSTPVGGDTQQ